MDLEACGWGEAVCVEVFCGVYLGGLLVLVLFVPCEGCDAQTEDGPGPAASILGVQSACAENSYQIVSLWP